MKRIVITLLALLVMTQGCNKGFNGISLGYIVQGSVSSAQTNQRLEGVTVMVGGRTAVTNQGGTYAIAELTAGQHTITASKAGYQTYVGTITIDQAIFEKTISLVPEG